MSTVRDEAAALIADGFRVWPISRGTKTPARAGFKREHGPVCASVDEFTEATEVGVLCGPCTAAGPGARFVCLDYDGPVPAEHRVGGEPTLTSKNGAHEWYRVPAEVTGFRQSQRVRRGDGWAVDTRDFGGYAIETKNGEALWDDGVPSLPRDITQAEVNALFPPPPAVAPAAPPATGPRVAPTQSWVNAFVARVLGRPEGTNDCFGAAGSVLAASGWTNDEIALALDTWFGDYPLGRHRTSALSAADKRRAGIEPVPGFPKLAELGIPWVVDAPAEIGAEEILALLAEEDANAGAQSDSGPFHFITAEAIATEPVPDPNWLCEALVLAPGAPALISGYGGSGKTTFVQHLAICAAQGELLLGHYPVRRTEVVHIDQEQGAQLTRRRYQRLGLNRCAQLRLSCLPQWSLADTRAEARSAFIRAVPRNGLVIIDSFLASCGPFLDGDGGENASSSRAPLDFLTELSEATGSVFLVVHHSRKDRSDPMTSARGSSAINDAVGLHLTYEKTDQAKKPKLTRGKTRFEAPPGAIEEELEVSMVAQPDRGRGAYTLSAVSHTDAQAARTLSLCDDIRVAVASGLSVRSVKEMCRELHRREDDVRDAIKELGMVRRNGIFIIPE